MSGELLYAFTQHPDRQLGREQKRHLVDQLDRSKTLCGHPARWLWDYATPLAADCDNCLRAARTRDAALRP